MNDRLDRSRDFTRFLDNSGEGLSLPSGTTLHILPLVETGTQVRDGAVREAEARETASIIREAQTAVGVVSPYAASTQWALSPMRFFRLIPWTEFPVVSRPHHSLRDSHRCIIHDLDNDVLVRPLTVTIADALASALSVFLHLDPGPLHERAVEMLLPVLEALGDRGDVEVYVVTTEGVGLSSVDDLLDRCAHHEPMIRFLYNYSVNFRAIAGKALVHALKSAWKDGRLPFADRINEMPAPPGRKKTTPEEFLASRIAQIEAGIYRGLDHPIMLQALYKVRNAGSLKFLSRDGGPGLFKVDGDKWVWTGRGAHGDAVIDRMDAQGAVQMSGASTFLMEQGDGLRLSEAGEMFLDALHPDCEDANVLCRWAGRPLTQEDSDAMDNWIMAKFSKMKTRVNLLPQDSEHRSE